MFEDFGTVDVVGEGKPPGGGSMTVGHSLRSLTGQKAMSAKADRGRQSLRRVLGALAAASMAAGLAVSYMTPVAAAPARELLAARTTISTAGPAQPMAGEVPGYTRAQAASLVARCEVLQNPSEPDATLRAVARNPYISTLVLTTTSGWQTCAVAPDGVPRASGSSGLQTWAASDGWMDFSDVRTAKQPPPETAKAPTSAPNYYLTGPLQVVFAGSGVIGTSGAHIKTRSLGELPPT